ncbi:hypothetical protein TNCV_1694941 [Trichonephila clavipes]|nr:hypothetical protein TNCV_1694941 [Trichonephila clavipes]
MRISYRFCGLGSNTKAISKLNLTGVMTLSSAPYLETTILLVLLAWLIEGVASLRQGSMGLMGSAIGIKYCYWLYSKLAKTALGEKNLTTEMRKLLS